MEIESGAKHLMKLLIEHGFEAYAVGGCVRDSLMGKTPHDWDICTSARPEDIKRTMSELRCIETGIKHGTITVIYKNTQYEITSMRTESGYSDNRHPENVHFVGDIELDLMRRDFTVNAIACDYRGSVLDIYQGTDDIKNRIIRCVGDADKRFNEDALRIMRALRFAAVLGFNIEKKTEESIHKNKLLLKNISAERIREEFLKLLCGSGAAQIISGYIDVIGVFIPEIMHSKGFEQNTPHHCFDVLNHILESMNNTEPDPFFRCVMFFHDIGKPFCLTEDKNEVSHFHGHNKKSAEITETVLKRLKFPSAFITRAVKLIEYHDVRPPAEQKSVRRMMKRIGYEDMKALLKVQKADVLAQSMYMREDKLKRIEAVSESMEKIYETNKCFCRSQLNINGNDIIAEGITGKDIGRAIDFLLNAVMEEKVSNTKEDLLAYLREAYDGQK